MAAAVVIPKMGMTMESGTLVTWLAADGAEVTVGQPLFHMVTEKLDCEVEAEQPGRLVHAVPPDTTLEPGGVVGWLVAAGEAAPMSALGGSDEPADPALVASGHVVVSGHVVAVAGNGGRLLVSPNARRVARDLGVDVGRVTGTGPAGRITSEDVLAHAATQVQDPAAAAAEPTRLLASPIARKLADRLGVDLSGVLGTGPGGRITREDVEGSVGTAAAASGGHPAPSSTAVGPTQPSGSTAPGAAPGVSDSIRLIGMRGTIAKRMHESLQQMAQLTIGMEVRADRLVKLRDQLKKDWSGDAGRRIPSYTDFVLKASALALREHPLLNAQVTDTAIELLTEIHVGLAVALDNGLVVPPLRNADALSLADIAAEAYRLATSARDGALAMDELVGGTFSVTTLGSEGVDLFTPVINPPNVAILGVGRIRDGVRWKGDKPKKSQQVTLSLTFDHRAVDGVPAARFLASIRDLLERPTRLLS